MPEQAATMEATALPLMQGEALIFRPERALLARVRLDADGRNWMLWVRRVGNEVRCNVTGADGRALDHFWGDRAPPCFALEDDQLTLDAVLEWLRGLADAPPVIGVDAAPGLVGPGVDPGQGAEAPEAPPSGRRRGR